MAFGCFFGGGGVGCTPVRLIPLQVVFSFRVVELIGLTSILVFTVKITGFKVL